jgi:hypothetical protein
MTSNKVKGPPAYRAAHRIAVVHERLPFEQALCLATLVLDYEGGPVVPNSHPYVSLKLCKALMAKDLVLLTGDMTDALPVKVRLTVSEALLDIFDNVPDRKVIVEYGSYRGRRKADWLAEVTQDGMDMVASAIEGLDWPTGALPRERDSDEVPQEPARPAGSQTPGRRESLARRVVRSTEVAAYVKKLHDHTCQACGTRLSIGTDGYSEGAHIRGLGRPHDGPDIPANVLCLCPNCHVLFDNGALIIDEEHVVRVNGQPTGTLRTHPHHVVEQEYLAYHRSIHL